jgi:hypothetical protein
MSILRSKTDQKTAEGISNNIVRKLIYRANSPFQMMRIHHRNVLIKYLIKWIKIMIIDLHLMNSEKEVKRIQELYR